MADVLTDVIATLSISTTLYAMAAELTPPWGVAFPASDGAYFHVVNGAPCWLRLNGQDPFRLGDGDLVLIAHGDAHRISGARRGRAQVRFDIQTWQPNTVVTGVDMGDHTASLDGSDHAAEEPGAVATLVCGAITAPTPAANPLLRQLPQLLVVSSDDSASEDLALTLALVRRETMAARPGAEAVLSRLGNVLVVQLVRCWLATASLENVGWLRALGDTSIASALQAIHDDPAAPWSVPALAEQAHLSRSRFAQRFAQLVGTPPMTYLTDWRMTLAAHLLASGQPVGKTARAVGYQSEPAFSRAFTQHHGRAPSRWPSDGKALA